MHIMPYNLGVNKRQDLDSQEEFEHMVNGTSIIIPL